MSLRVTQGYCPKSGNNTLVSVGDLDVYFSYKTPIAFCLNGKITIRKNEWSTTTGKHLNAVNSDKSIRIDGDSFKVQYREALDKLGLMWDLLQ